MTNWKERVKGGEDPFSVWQEFLHYHSEGFDFNQTALQSRTGKYLAYWHMHPAEAKKRREDEQKWQEKCEARKKHDKEYSFD